jgi:serralysin
MSNVQRVGAGSVSPAEYNLDTLYNLGYTSYRGKPIAGLSDVIAHIDSGTSLSIPADGVITYGFFVGNHAVGVNNNPHLGDGRGYSPFSDAQKAAAISAIQLWDDLIPLTFKNVGDVSVSDRAHNDATILLQNTTTGPAQAWTYYPGSNHQYARIASDVWTDTPSDNWTNNWFGNMGYGDTTLIHELGHALGLSHPGAYNFGPGFAVNYDNGAEYAQDSTQYSIMSYWDASETGARIVNWNTLLFSYAQTPLVHDVLTIQEKYGADPTTRATDTTYGFHSNAGNNLFDFSQNSYPYLTIYDAGGNDTIDLSGFTVSQFVDLHPGAFSSIGAGMPDTAVANAQLAQLTALSGQDWGTFDAATTSYYLGLYEQGNAARIQQDTALYGQAPVAGIATSEYQNVSIAYSSTIENAIGGSARDLLWGNEVANTLSGLGGNDVLNGFGGNDRLIGGAGNDTLTGGSGSDVFVFANDGSTDTMTDFQTGVDKIDLTALTGVTAANVTYNAATHQVQIDTDHNGVADLFINSANVVGAGDYLFH